MAIVTRAVELTELSKPWVRVNGCGQAIRISLVELCYLSIANEAVARGSDCNGHFEETYDKLGRDERRRIRATVEVEEAPGDTLFEGIDFKASKEQMTNEKWPSHLLKPSVVIERLTEERRRHRVKDWDRILAIATGS